MPEQITATFKIVTPMFLGGANPDELADTIRPPSVKGALRFWWRALQWGRIRASTSCDEAALALLHDKEAQFFGLAASKNAGGQGTFQIQVNRVRLKTTAEGTVHPQFAKFNASRYLGYGLITAFPSQNTGEKAGQLKRPCFDEGQEFTVRIRCRNTFHESIKEALIAWGLFGGLGSRSRHGLGAIAIQSIRQDGQSIWNVPRTYDQYVTEIRKLMDAANGLSRLPPYTAFSASTRIDVLKAEESSPFSAMNTFALGLMMYRSWGNNGKVLGLDSEKNFDKDHKWKYSHDRDDFHPRRVVFGLPHNYGETDTLKVKPAKHNRRASPLFFHVHPLGKSFVGVIIYLPSQFLPQNEKINAGGTHVTANIDWTVITNFLDGMRKIDNRPRFPEKTTIKGSGE